MIKIHLKTIFINCIIFVALITSVEIGFRFFVGHASDHMDFRSTRPAPYGKSEYFSKDFLQESVDHYRPTGVEFIPENYKGTFFNIARNRRKTTSQPTNWERRVLLFGGSTVYNSEVPDNLTIASQLQKILLDNGLNNIRVENHGVTSIGTKQQLLLLQKQHLSPKDIVIFYDGVNDVIQTVMYGNNKASIAGNDIARPFWQRKIQQLSRNSSFFNWFLRKLNANYKIINLPERLSILEESYLDHLTKANSFTSKSGATFIHFLQPTIFTLDKITGYEKFLLNSGLINSQTITAFEKGYPILKATHKKLASKNIHSNDLTHILNDADEPVYLDFCHVTEKANYLIANSFFLAIKEKLK